MAGLWSCNGDDSGIRSFKDDSSIASLNGTWRVISFEDFTTHTAEYKTQENSWGRDIIVTFDDTINPKLFSGQVTTNAVQGEFDYIGKRQFQLHRYGSTYVGQPRWADQFGEAMLDKTNTFAINREELRIYYLSQSKSVTLVRE